MIYFKEFPEIDIAETVADATIYMKKFTECFEYAPMRPWREFDLRHFIEHVPSFKTLFDPLGLEPVGVVPVIVRGQTRIHIDPYSNPYSVRLNIPIYNCEHSETRFFELASGRQAVLKAANEQHNVYYDINESDCHQVDKVVLKHITALAIGRPHQVVNTGPIDLRLALTIPIAQKEKVSRILFGDEMP